MDDIKEIKISSFDNILNKLENFKYTPSLDIKSFLENPIQAYIDKILPIKIKDPTKRKNIIGRLEGVDYRHSADYDYKETIDINRVQMIFDKYDATGNFSFMTSKERRYLLKFDRMWITNEYDKYKFLFMNYLRSNDKPCKYFRQVLKLYIRQYSKLKRDSSFKNLFKNIYNKYIENKKYIPDTISNIFRDCDLLNNDAEKKLADICLSERRKTDTDIMKIISERYQFIKPKTDLFDEIIIKICDICKNRIRDAFYFDLLFNEVLNSDIDPIQSGKIVSNLVTFFGRDEDIPIANLEKIKIALLRNPNYGDPRENPSNWVKVDTDARHIFITWLAQADLEFFFKIAFKGVYDPHERKQFWEKYINHRTLVESHVIWSQTHYYSKEIQEEKEKSKINYKLFEYEDECSCFILKFNNFYIVEFSGYGNALYFYSEEEFYRRININKITFSKVDDLKRKGPFTVQYSKQSRDVPNLDYCGSFTIHHSENPATWKNLAKEVLEEYGVNKKG